jgi:hypothetical protein
MNAPCSIPNHADDAAVQDLCLGGRGGEADGENDARGEQRAREYPSNRYDHSPSSLKTTTCNAQSNSECFSGTYNTVRNGVSRRSYNPDNICLAFVRLSHSARRDQGRAGVSGGAAGELKRKLAEPEAPPFRHLSLSDLYREKVPTLCCALGGDDRALAGAREAIRG